MIFEMRRFKVQKLHEMSQTLTMAIWFIGSQEWRHRGKFSASNIFTLGPKSLSIFLGVHTPPGDFKLSLLGIVRGASGARDILQTEALQEAPHGTIDLACL